MKALCFLFMVLLLSCHKEYKKPPSFQATDDPENLTEKLIGNWKLYEQTSLPANDWDGDGKTETDMYSTLSACEKDAGFNFLTTGKGIIRISCIEGNEINWKVINNSNDYTYQILSNGLFGSYLNHKIIQLNQNYFIITRIMQASNGKTYTITSRYFRR